MAYAYIATCGIYIEEREMTQARFAQGAGYLPLSHALRVYGETASSVYTVEPPITDPPKGRQPPYSGQSLWYGLNYNIRHLNVNAAATRRTAVIRVRRPDTPMLRTQSEPKLQVLP